MIFRIMPAGSLTYAPDVRSKELPFPKYHRVLFFLVVCVCVCVCVYVCTCVRVRFF